MQGGFWNLGTLQGKPREAAAVGRAANGGWDATAAGQMTIAPSARSGLQPGGGAMVINQLPGTRAATQDPSGMVY